MTAEQQVQMAKAALAEAGWPDSDVFIDPTGKLAYHPRTQTPREVLWRAGAIVGQATGQGVACWPCWKANGHDGRGLKGKCEHDTWDGAPPVVRRETTP